MEAFRIAVELRELKKMHFTVALKFSLDSGNEIRGVNFHTSAELATQLNWTPPSLYLFKTGKEPWIQNQIELVELERNGGVGEDVDIGLFRSSIPAKRCFYSELRPNSWDEYARSFILIA